METPIIVLISLWAASLLISANQHGKEKTGKYNFWASLIGLAINVALLYWAGLFD